MALSPFFTWMLRAKKVFRTPGRDDSAQRVPIQMELVEIPAGSFWMGSPEGESGRSADEVQHERYVDQFWIGKYEVTQGQWEAVMGAEPPYSSGCGVNCPVELRRWDDIQEFIARLNERERDSGFSYRLPTEAEWEYAARAGTTGARYGELDEIAWWPGNSAGRPHPVGLKRANPWGLHDVLGNVWEWTSDWYRSYPGADREFDATGEIRVIRGGGDRVADRGQEFLSPYNIGFRVVKTREELALLPLHPWMGIAKKEPRIQMEFVEIPAGSFWMGSPKGENGRRDDEHQHQRFVDQFWIGKYEVTQGQWEAVMRSNPSGFSDCEVDCPVECVGNQVQAFIGKLNEREAETGYRYRLPTEAEWEYAARAGTTGARFGELDEIAWWSGNSAGRTHPVGRKRANAWGLHDMLGNVWEWTADSYRPYPGYENRDWSSSAPVVPARAGRNGPRGLFHSGDAREFDSHSDRLVLRGGCYWDDAEDVRLAHRVHWDPDLGNIPEFGFRLVREGGALARYCIGPRLGSAEEEPRTPESDDAMEGAPIGVEFVRIPAGSFWMGSAEGEVGRSDDEHRHERAVGQFWMGKHEVTQGQWEAVMGSNPSRFSDRGADYPVESVSRDDVQEFIARLNELESEDGCRYRLPTEAEWEYAARAGTTGARYGELDEIAWWSGNSAGRTHPVGRKRPNAWGLHDMLGNVWEWTADWYRSYLGADRKFSDLCLVNRGASWGSHAWSARCAYRNRNSPRTRSRYIGFRLVRTE